MFEVTRQARHYRKGRRGRVRLIVVHVAVSPEGTRTAEALADYFATTDRKASAHFNCDSNSWTCSVHPDDTAFGAGGVNHDGIHIEHAGQAGQTREQWLDEYGVAMLGDVSAPLVRRVADEYGVPLVHLTDAQLAAGASGFVGHDQAVRVYGGDHWDPGPHFPWDRYMEWVRSAHGEEDELTPELKAYLDARFGDVDEQIATLDKRLLDHTNGVGDSVVERMEARWEDEQSPFHQWMRKLIRNHVPPAVRRALADPDGPKD